jgi:hypothetical protein
MDAIRNGEQPAYAIEKRPPLQLLPTVATLMQKVMPRPTPGTSSEYAQFRVRVVHFDYPSTDYKTYVEGEKLQELSGRNNNNGKT